MNKGKAGILMFLILAAVLVLLTGCQSGEAEATPTVAPEPTLEPTAIPTSAPEPTSEPVPLYLEGSEKMYDLPFCFDFDTGAISTEPEYGCDVYFLKDDETMTISFRSGAVGNWMLVEDVPDPEDCLSVQSLSAQSLFPQDLNAYICYITNNGRIGYLAVNNFQEAAINMQFKTFRMIAPDFSPSEEIAKYASNTNVTLNLPGCYDLDTGLVLGMNHPLCDLKMYAGDGEDSVLLEAYAPAGAAYASAFSIEPTVNDCMDLDTYSSEQENVSPLGYYLCYRTAENRYGYINFTSVSESRAEFDWITYALNSDVVLTSEPIEEVPVIEINGDSLAEFVDDVTILDGTDFNPGETFTKTWRLRNAGEDAWTTEYKIVFVRGDQLGAPDELNLVQEVAPGEEVDISVVMVAPTETGTFTGYWLLQDSAGNLFGVSEEGDPSFWVQIDVIGTAEATPTPTQGAAVTEDPNATPFPTNAPSSEELKITGVNISVDPVAFTGTCPTTVVVSGSIASTGAGEYLFSLEAGTTTQGFSFNLPGATTAAMTNDGQWDFSYTLDFSGSVTGWFWIHIEGDEVYDSAQVDFSVNCE